VRVAKTIRERDSAKRENNIRRSSIIASSLTPED